MVCLPELGFRPKVDWGTGHLMVGLLATVEMVTEKVHSKIFQQRQGVMMVVEGFEAFCDEGGIAEQGLIHKMGCQKRKHDEVLTRTFLGSDTM